jgi:uncharacterized protein (UPF0332 family)
VIDEDPGMALSGAHDAMLYAVRAALSERDLYAKTHRGAWSEFRRVYVASGEFDGDLVAAAQRVQAQREDADYDAWLVPREVAAHVIELARSFIAAIERLLAG